MTTRRRWLAAATTAALAPLLGTASAGTGAARAGGKAPAPDVRPPGALPRRPSVRPPRIRSGDTIGLMIPSSANWDPMDIDVLVDALASLGLKSKLGKHVYDRRGYMAGRDEDRAADFNAMVRDPEVRAIHCIRGGWGAARLLPLIDFEAFARTPKAVIGYSDITALLLSLHARTGAITFHGPNGASDWNRTNVDWLQRVVWQGEAAVFDNPREPTGAIVPDENRTRTITPGRARGRLLGGNLTVLTALVGSPYLPDFTDSILFLEDVQEAPYRIDRMLVQLKLSGVLERVRGVVWGTCSKCGPGEGFGSLTIPDVLDDHVKSLGVPAYWGAMVGHIGRQFTLPVGAEVEIDADRGAVRMLEPAVA
jgi:muramoyltetrapeptide carboxypeptidase